MGDHRATVKIEFTFHGKTYKMDSWINWSCWGSDESGIDQRVVDFFREATRDGLARYEAAEAERYQREHAAEIEAHERAQLARLQSKYS
jgi:hypothetical protein